MEATLVRLHDVGVQGLVWNLLSNFLLHTVSQSQISGWTRALLKGGSCPHSFSISWWTAVQPRSSLLLQESLLPGSVQCRFTDQLYADDLVLVADSPMDLPPRMPFTDGGVGSASSGVGPTKSAVKVFGPRRRVPDCHLHLGGASLPVVSSYKYPGVLLSPTLSWTKHVQLLISRGNRLLAQCVAPVQMASSIFRVCVLPSVSWWSEFFAHSPAGLHLLDGAISQMGSSRSGLASSGLAMCWCTLRTWMA